MKFKIEITKEVIDKSLMCGVKSLDQVSTNCGFAVAYSGLVPVSIGIDVILFFNKKNDFIRNSHGLAIRGIPTQEQVNFINIFDDMSIQPHQRYTSSAKHSTLKFLMKL